MIQIKRLRLDQLRVLVLTGSDRVGQVHATPGSGTLNVVLSHYDDGPKDGVTQSTESDVDITFPVRIDESTPQKISY